MNKLATALLKLAGIGCLIIIAGITLFIFFLINPPNELFFSHTIKTNIQPVIEKEFAAAGFNGTIQVKQYSQEFMPSTREFINFDYTEIVDGKPLTFSSGVTIDSSKNTVIGEAFPHPINRDNYIGTAFMSIVETAMWQQPYVQEQFDIMKNELTKVKIKDMSLSRIAGEFFNMPDTTYNTQDLRQTLETMYEGSTLKTAEALLNLPNKEDDITYQDVQQAQDALFATFETNRQAQHPLAGLYDIDIKHFLANRALMIDIDYQVVVAHLSDGYSISDNIRSAFFETVKTLDYTQFWDGYYTIGFSFTTPKGGHSGSVSDTVTLHIKNGKMHRAF